MEQSETKFSSKLILPLAKRSILAGIMMSFARALGEVWFHINGCRIYSQ